MQRLDLSKTILLHGWLKENDEHLLQTNATQTEAAALATKELSFTVSLANIKSMLEASNGSIKWKGSRQRGTRRNYNDRTRVIASALLALYRKLDETPPETLGAIVYGESTEESHADPSD